MSYQVLARKWRPRTFAELVGQEHVLRALVNALDNDRLHHAYLFTGTRGVGKTTIARILAKSLNCERGISATPCGECSACVEIGEGRFVDLIEVDAASRTKVEDTRELLENVQYRPTRGRYKVYLIDEVHMLSGHSFNALLKTLEEPPPHVKFLLATTDPQRLPVTILSRCLQFNLKHLGVERISQHLSYVLGAENVPYEEAALRALARAADGSMRDALSLTDQAIAHGGGQVTETEVDAMLGTINRREVQELCRTIAAGDAPATLALVARMAEFSPDYGQALGEMLATWHRVAIAQQVPEAVDNSLGDHELVKELAGLLSPEDVQLLYQIGLLGRRDLPLAADPRSGFEMVLLRQLAFQPVGVTPPAGPPPGGEKRSDVVAPAAVQNTAVDAAPASPDGATSAAISRGEAPAAPAPVRHLSPVAPASAASTVKKAPPEPDAGDPGPDRDSEEAYFSGNNETMAGAEGGATVLDSESEERPVMATAAGDAAPMAGTQDRELGEPVVLPASSSSPTESVGGDAPNATEDPWLDLYPQLPLGGNLQNTASNLALERREGKVWHFIIDREHSALFEGEHQQRLAEVLQQQLGAPQEVVISPGEPATETPARRAGRIRAERQRAAVATLRQDPLVAELLARFSGELLEETVVPRQQ